MGLYTYRVADLMTGNMLAELPLRGVTFSSKLNAAGSFSAELPLSDLKLVQNLDPIGSTQPGRTAIWIDRNGVLVWGGILWTRSYDSTTESLKLGGNDFGSYFEHRYISDKLTFSGVDQLAYAKQLLQYAQGQNASFPKPGGNIGVGFPNPYPTSSVAVSFTFSSYELRQIAQAINDQSQTDTGFDYAFDVAYDSNGNPTITFNPSYPRRGRTAVLSGFVIELPGSIVSYQYPEDGTMIEVTAYATGGGTATAMFVSSATTTSLIDAGYPLLEGVQSYKDVSVQATLDAHARADAAALAGPVVLPEVTILGSGFPSLGSFITGDDIRIRITDKRFNNGFNADGTPIGPGLDTFERIIGYEVAPGDDAPETVKLSLGEALS